MESFPVKRKNCIILLSLDFIAVHWESLKEYDRPGQEIVWGDGLEIEDSALIIDADKLFKEIEFKEIEFNPVEIIPSNMLGFPILVDIFRPRVLSGFWL